MSRMRRWNELVSAVSFGILQNHSVEVINSSLYNRTEANLYIS